MHIIFTINFFHFKNVSVKHLSEVRKILEPYAASVAAEAISEEGIEKLKKINSVLSVFKQPFQYRYGQMNFNFG